MAYAGTWIFACNLFVCRWDISLYSWFGQSSSFPAASCSKASQSALLHMLMVLLEGVCPALLHLLGHYGIAVQIFPVCTEINMVQQQSRFKSSSLVTAHGCVVKKIATWTQFSGIHCKWVRKLSCSLQEQRYIDR